MPVRTRNLAHGNALVPSAGTVLFVCPADRTAIVKDAVLVNNAGATANLTLRLRRSGADVSVIREAVADASRLQSTGRFVVLHEGDQLILLSSVNAGTIGWSISGSLLAGDPA